MPGATRPLPELIIEAFETREPLSASSEATCTEWSSCLLLLISIHTSLIVDLPLSFISECLISLINRSKLLLGARVLVDIRMILFGQLEVSLLDLVLAGPLRDIQRLIEVLVVQDRRGSEGSRRLLVYHWI